MSKRSVRKLFDKLYPSYNKARAERLLAERIINWELKAVAR